jgi:hypothetical protein
VLLVLFRFEVRNRECCDTVRTSESEHLEPVFREMDRMATREKRLAQFDGSGEPPPGQAVEVLCEDHSGTYQLPFQCFCIEGQWHNQESGGRLEATVVGWRLPRMGYQERSGRSGRGHAAFDRASTY